MTLRDEAARIAAGVLLAQPDCRDYRGTPEFEAAVTAVEARLFLLTLAADGDGFARACDGFAGAPAAGDTAGPTEGGTC